MKKAPGMRSLFKRRLQLQLLFILLAAVLVASLSVLLISDAIESAEGVVLSDAARTLTAAVSELDQQYQDRVAADSAWLALPVPAQDTSLRGVSQAVLRSYPGVEGGYYDGAHFLGYSYPTHDTGGNKTDVPTAELNDILAAISQSHASGTAQRTLRGQHDIVVIEAKSKGRNTFASWTMKRLAGRSDPGSHRREILLSALVLAALISIAGTLATGILLQRGIGQIKAGLSALESDFSYRLPGRNDELGEISHSINRMAEVRQKLETDLRREDRLRAVGRLVAAIAHEIRNPLNSIRLSIQYLERRLGGNGVRAEDLRPVIEEVDRLSALLTNLLTFQKTRQPELRDQPVAPVVQRCVNLVQPQADARNIEIRAEEGAPGLEAQFDAEQLTQMLMNLLLNAIEAAGQNGTIDVRVEQRGAMAHIEVHDSGPGLTQEQREHLFEAFYTTKANGTGLGLAVSRELAAGMGGSLHYRNDRPGATFEIELSGTPHANANDTDR
jgi:signal transduction histidine kinase